MWILNVPRDLLLLHGFVYDEEDKCYIQDLGFDSYGGEAYINDDEDFFRIKMLCWEFDDGDAIFTQEHIADRNDWKMQELDQLGMVTFSE